MPQATIFFASLLTLLYLFLVVQVIRMRYRTQQAYGAEKEHPELMRAVRAHGNWQEYTPLFLILLYLEESRYHIEWLCYGLGLLFLLGRLSHAYSFLVNEGRGFSSGWPLWNTIKFRSYGMAATIFPLLILALALLMQWVRFMSVR